MLNEMDAYFYILCRHISQSFLPNGRLYTILSSGFSLAVTVLDTSFFLDQPGSDTARFQGALR